jgi:hypothetical protein
MYLSRKKNNKYFNDDSDKQIEEIIFKSVTEEDNFEKEIGIEMNKIKKIFKEYLMIK